MRTSLTPFVVLIVVTLAFLSETYGQSASRTSLLRPIQQNGKWGYIDSTGKIIVKPQFAWAEEFSEGLAAIESEVGKHGYIDETGGVVIEPKFDNWTDFSEGLAAVSLNLEWGYIDKTGGSAIQPQIVSVHDIETDVFSEGLTPAKRNGKWGYIDTSGRFVIEPQYEEAHTFSEGLAAVLIREKWGFIDHGGRVVITPKYGIGYDTRQHGFSEGVALVYREDKCSYIDKTGRTLIKFPCTQAEQFAGGIASVRIGEDKAEKRGYINKQGKFVWGAGRFQIQVDGRDCCPC